MRHFYFEGNCGCNTDFTYLLTYVLTYLLTYKLTYLLYLLTYLFTYSLHGAEFFLRS